MNKNSNFYFLVAVIAVMSWVAVTSLSFKRLEAKLLPLLTSGVIILLSAGALAAEGLKSRNQANKEVPRRAWSLNRVRRFALIMGWMMGFLLAIYVVGFLAAIPFSVLMYLKMSGRPWLPAIAFTALFSICIYVIFELGLKSELYEGLLFSFFNK